MAENSLRSVQRAKLSPQDTQLNSISGIFLPQIKLNTEKTVLSGHSKKNLKIGFQDRLSLHACQKYCRMFQGDNSAIPSTCIKLAFVIKNRYAPNLLLWAYPNVCVCVCVCVCVRATVQKMIKLGF